MSGEGEIKMLGSATKWMLRSVLLLEVLLIFYFSFLMSRMP